MTGKNWLVSLRKRIQGAAVGGVAVLAAGALPVTAAVFTVSNVNDSGSGSLREAISGANATSGLDTIAFQIPGTGVHTINILSALPFITDSVIIDGTTQSGYVNKPVIELNGVSATSSDGLRLVGGTSTIRGLAINRFPLAGIHILAPSATNLVVGNFLGTDTSGTASLGNGASGGIWVEGSAGNTIGGTTASVRNLISGNTGPGIYMINATGNTIQGNYIGTSVAGTSALGNTNNGVTIYGASAGNLVGGVVAGARNIIAGNGGSGVYLTGLSATGNLVQGNYVGTDLNGSVAIPNAGDGVTVNGAPGNTIGGASAGAGNLLSGNAQTGVGLKGSGADGNWVQGNLIGTDATGQVALGNSLSGLVVLGGKSNVVGGSVSAACNVISGNKSAGVYLTTNAVGNLIQGNFIGVDSTGGNHLGNVVNGVTIESASFNTVGGIAGNARNIISGNTNCGVEIFSTATTGNRVQGNYIGPSVTGLAALPNKRSGIHIQSPGNTIGGTADGAGNVISGNGEDGIFLDGINATSNSVQGNLIGSAAGGTQALGNSRGGIGISLAPANIIGGTASGAGNLISANLNYHGIYLFGSGATRNVIQGNKIGTDITGNVALSSPYQGIYLEGATTNTIGGAAPGAGNLISGNNRSGIYLVNASWNVLQGNWIGTASDGVTALGNLLHAVDCQPGASNNTIGGEGGAGNRLAFSRTYSGYGYAGVRVRDGSTNNAILGNSIFSNDGLGIDLGAFGVTANMACGTRTGANMGENFPVLSQAVSGNGTGIRGILNSRPNASFLVQFFANPTCDSSGNGEGQLYLGQQTLVTSSNCTNSFVVNFPVQVPVGYSVTATATDSAGNTSEFSACVPVAPVPTLAIRPSAAQEIALAWTNTATGFVLEQTDSLSPIVQWMPVTNAPVLANGQFVVTIFTTGARKFYRLSFE